MGKLREAIYEETEKVITAFITWGLGILFMIAYCLFVYWLNQINLYFMILGALAFLAISFFFIDLWWRLSKHSRS